jgi:hypothetical protein
MLHGQKDRTRLIAEEGTLSIHEVACLDLRETLYTNVDCVVEGGKRMLGPISLILTWYGVPCVVVETTAVTALPESPKAIDVVMMQPELCLD